MDNTEEKIIDFNETLIKSGFVEAVENMDLYDIIHEIYKKHEDAFGKFINQNFKRRATINLDDIKITNNKYDYAINLKKKQFIINFDFKLISKDTKKWGHIDTFIKKYLKSKVTELCFEKQRKQLNKLERKVTKLSLKKGVTKKPMSMIKAERLTEFGFNEPNSLFKNIKTEKDFLEIKQKITQQNLLHLKTNNQYIYDALLYYVQLYRYSKTTKDAELKNMRNGKPIVTITKETDTKHTYEERLRIQDSWVSFCEKAGVTDVNERKEILKDLRKQPKFSALAIAKNEDGSSEIANRPSFLECKFIVRNKNQNNYKNNTDNHATEDIVLWVDTDFLGSITNIDSKNHAGWAYFPHPYQKILQNVFENSDKLLELNEYCEIQGFRNFGGKYSIGYKHVYDEIHADIHFKQVNNYKYEGEDCLLIVLDKEKIKSYAQRSYKSAFRSNKFFLKEAVQFILRALKVIQLACDDQNKDLIQILHFEYIKPTINIFIKKIDSEKTKMLEKTHLLNF